jgi:D-tyrosyl-tRNA(Tyr) deacylase
MRLVVIRSKNSSVSVNNEIIGSIDHGLMILVGISTQDTEEDVVKLANKTLNMRIFDDESGVMNKSILDVGGSILSVSQFTLLADTKKGNRPSYINAMKGEEAIELYNKFNEILSKYVHVETGKFGADMQVSILNDGPVTIILDSKGDK